MARNPRDFGFWSDEDEDFSDTLMPLILAALAAGMAGGVDILPPELRDTVDFDIYDQLVASFLLDYRFDVLARISQTTMQAVLDILESFGKPGGPQTEAELRKALREGPLSDNRAAMIAITEITRLFAISGEFIWIALGVIMLKEWVTSLDERVCPICGPMHGATALLGQSFPGGLTIPAHPRCRCWERPVIDPLVVAGLALGGFGRGRRIL